MTCVNRIINAAPALVVKGTDDKSGQVIPIPSRSIPQHCPLWIVQAKSGPLGARLINPAEKELLYGAETFQLTGRYSNHQTLGMNASMKEANTGVVHRVSNGTRANMTLSVDLVQTDVQNYDRNVDGSIKIDTNGSPVPHPTEPVVPGYSAKFVLTSEDLSAGVQVGNKTITAGSQISTGGAQSTLIPLLELVEQFPGEFGNNNGIILSAPQALDIDTSEAIDMKSFPFLLTLITRDNAATSARSLSTILGEKTIEVHLNPEAESKFDGSSLHITDLIKKRYNNTTDGDLPLAYGPYKDDVYLYQDNVSFVMKSIYEQERAYIDAHPNAVSAQPLDLVTPNGNEEYLFNLLSGYDLEGTPYYTYQFDLSGNVANGVLLSPLTNLWAGNGEDNIMSTTEYEREVRNIIAKYGNCAEEEQDLASHPENWFHDTGFGFETKLVLNEFIGQRPDTQLSLQTHYDTTNVKGWRDQSGTGGAPNPPDYVVPEVSSLTRAEELQIGGILESQLRLKPESTYFGTSTTRGYLFVNSAEIDESGWDRRVGYVHYLIPRLSRYMGAGDGKWVSGESFSAAPGSVIRSLTNTSVKWIPYSSRVQHWKKSLNFPLTYDYDYEFMTAIQSVYTDDTSVLNSLTNVSAIAHLWTVAYQAWREFSGTDDKTPAELRTAVTNFVIGRLRGKFDDRYNVLVDVYFTTDDEKRGYSWTLKYKIEMGTMYTVETVIVESYRFNQVADAGLITV